MIKNFNKAVLSIAMLAGVATLGVSTPSAAQPTRSAAQATASALPEAIKRAAIATRSDRSGRIAGARIGNSNHYIVYIETPRGCGSGGCRAQIWTLDGGRPVRKESIAVGRLPIVLLPQTDNGMPRIGVTTTNESNQLAILPIAYDGQNYLNDMYDALLAPNAGRPLLTRGMLQAF